MFTLADVGTVKIIKMVVIKGQQAQYLLIYRKPHPLLTNVQTDRTTDKDDTLMSRKKTEPMHYKENKQMSFKLHKINMKQS